MVVRPHRPDLEEPIVLTLTDHAVDVVRDLTHAPDAPPDAALRVAPGGDGLELSLVGTPGPDDDVIHRDGVNVYVERQASQLLDEQTLDASVTDGQVQFFLARPQP